MILSIMLAISLFVFLLPSSFLLIDRNKEQLFSRIEIEHQQQIDAAFYRKSLSFPIINKLIGNQERMKQLMQLLGMDQQKLSLSLARLRWNITIEDILLAKCAGGLFIVFVTSFLFYELATGVELKYGHYSLIALAVIVFLVPTYLIESADKKAQAEIKTQTSAIFSIVLSLIEAGMPIHNAVKSAARKFPGRLGKELELLEIEEKRCGNWRIALEEMAFRWDVDELYAIVAEINLSLTKGTSVAGNLSLQLEEQTKQQEDEIAEHINRLSIRLIPFVIVFMGVPLLFLVMGPSFIGITQHM